MKITLTTHGGLAAGIRRQPRVIDSAALPLASAEELAWLVSAVKNAPMSDEGGPGLGRDAMTYTVTIEEEGSKPTVLRQSDANLSSSFAALLQWLEGHLGGGS